MAAPGHEMHVGIAEAGKLAALKGDHAGALRHYRAAIRLCVGAKAPEVFFRHYTQCVMESLEQTGQFAEVIEYCAMADAHYRAAGACNPLQRRDHGSILERLGLVRLKAGETEAAREALEEAVTLAGPKALPLAETVLGWLRRGMRVEPRRLAELQKKSGYFTVREDRVDPARARPLPDPAKQETVPFG
ncbi:peptidylprolyl isomerase [Mangrovicoccus ximenensis]|uniref:peptidylprolyl isomerase n=1 Tax=Mangrovicoccus ximenensis TaxID=1911570 RepID=UPI000D3DA280|nr:peptidylprolyl isomerase [Mangrovicoccus ximenensis]